MTRINCFGSASKIAENKIATSRISESRKSITWGKNTGALLFGALLIVCSLTVGCTSDKPKAVSSNNQIPVTQNPTPNTMLSSNTPAPVALPAKPAAKKVVRKRPATVTYADQAYGVTFEYPRKYGLETGNAATELVASSPLPMNFVMPGGTALAAVELPETAFADTDLSAAYFNVSVNKDVTAEQCGEFAVPQPKTVASSDAGQAPVQPAPTESVSSKSVSTEAASTQTGSTQTGSTQATPTPSAPAQSVAEQTAPASTTAVAAASAPTSSPASSAAVSSTPAISTPATSATATSTSKLLLGDLELQSAEAVAGEGNRQSDTKYFHIFQNGGCYEFALNVTTMAHETEGAMKHVDRDKVFGRLAAIMATVKINPVAAPEVTASAPATPAAAAAPVTPAQ
jgi:hypothetical protein